MAAFLFGIALFCLISFCESAIFTTDLVYIINPDPSNPQQSETHNSSIIITINNETNTVLITMNSNNPRSTSHPFEWIGFGFEYNSFDATHNETYCIVLEYDIDDNNNPIVTEYTLGYKGINNTKYTNAEIIILSDQFIAVNQQRSVNVTRSINGTFSFPSTAAEELIISSAFGSLRSQITQEPIVRHQGNIDDRNHS